MVEERTGDSQMNQPGTGQQQGRLPEFLDPEKGGSDAGNPNIHVTISCGVATFPDDATALEQTLEYADQALLRAKKLGRNRVVLWDEGQTDAKTL